ncbi:Aste57867_21002 [Aphanomyces stellatus]|uniref:Aste57867_21002 protein n=1 Tax=Aphanomyces stellatus TaxID=120398 RepID=A0A485LGE2_9STRA|nr:hypothetical protein As57867_020934 [Aphanomyces stellatus]VFT97677.1 Aste57867_21002 [Aphanomyces stellatus]
MKFIVLAASVASFATAQTVSVINGGAKPFAVPVGVAPCSGASYGLLGVGTCPGPQAGLEFGACCVRIPDRPTLVMGCAARRSATDSCADLDKSLNNGALVPSSSTASPATTLSATPIVTPAVTESLAPVSTTTAAPVTTDAPITTDAPATTIAAPTTDATTTTPVPTTTSTPTPTPVSSVQVQSMSDAGAAASPTLQENTTSKANSILIGASIIGVAAAVIGGVLFVRKQKPSDAGTTPSTPPQPASILGAVDFSEETPCEGEDFLTPKEDLVCL